MRLTLLQNLLLRHDGTETPSKQGRNERTAMPFDDARANLPKSRCSATRDRRALQRPDHEHR